MRRSLLAAVYFGLWALVSATLSFANGVFENVRGDVKAAVGTAAPASVARNQRFVPGTTIFTGPGAQTVMRFDDGHTVVLNENTEFRVNQYSFDRDRPQSDNIALQLFKGALRSVTGLIGARNNQAFALVAPQATIGIRGTDFMIALVNPAYVSVLQGTISATNAAGTATFAAGATGTIASSAVLGAAIPASALPASVATTFGNLSSVALGAGAAGAGTGAGAGAGGAAGAGAAVGAGVGGITAGMVAAGVAVAGVAVAASTSSSSETPSTTTTVTTK